MVETAQKKWYVLHTYSGYEDKVKSDLLSRAQSMGMQDYIFRVMVPEEVERLLKNQGQPAKEPTANFDIGESVTITEGAFNGMVGKITDIQPDKYKLYVSVDMFGRATTAELDYDQVKKLDENE